MGIFDPAQEIPETFSSWFDPYPHLRADGGLGGMRVNDEGLVLGMRAGPGVDADNLCHEMAHLIETSDDRVCSPNWGMHYPMVEVLGREYPEPMTYQAIRREIRVWGIQRVLARMTGTEVKDHSELVQWFTDECHLRIALGLLGEESADFGLGYEERRQLVYDCVRVFVDFEEQKWTPERVRAEWDRKCALVEAWHIRVAESV